MNIFTNFFRNDSGATMIEYGLIAALISVVAIVALTGVGDGVKNIFNEIANKLVVPA